MELVSTSSVSLLSFGVSSQRSKEAKLHFPLLRMLLCDKNPGMQQHGKAH